MRLHRRFPIVAAAALAAAAGGCSLERDTSGLSPAPLSMNPIVFEDGFEDGLDFQAFLGSNLTALSIDTLERYSGSASLRFDVPLGTFAGGAFPTNTARDLSGYDALTFWAKASQPTVLDVAGLGNDNTGTSLYQASSSDFALDTTWRKFAVPIPLPARLAQETGLFFMADADPSATDQYSVWFDEVRFERLGTITNPRPSMTTETAGSFAGVTQQVRGTRTTFSVNGTDQVVDHFPAYLTFASSDESVATVAPDGRILAVGGGTAQITAKLGSVDVSGKFTIEVASPDPTGPAPTPPHPASDVIAVFSDAYPVVDVAEWSTTWDTARSLDLDIGGNPTKVFQLDPLNPPSEPFAAIDFQFDQIDAVTSGMTHLHLDLWLTGVPTQGVWYARVKLVDFGSDGMFTDGSNTPCDPNAPEADLSQNEQALLVANSDSTGMWTQLDIPIADFFTADIRGECLRDASHLAQMILVAPNGIETLYVDNVYFYR